MNKTTKNVSLLTCLLMDLAGLLTYAVPLLGEYGDVIWAPLSAYVFYKMFKNPLGATLNLLEEALPFLDFIPTFTIFYFLQKDKNKKLNP